MIHLFLDRGQIDEGRPSVSLSMSAHDAELPSDDERGRCVRAGLQRRGRGRVRLSLGLALLVAATAPQAGLATPPRWLADDRDWFDHADAASRADPGGWFDDDDGPTVEPTGPSPSPTTAVCHSASVQEKALCYEAGGRCYSTKQACKDVQGSYNGLLCGGLGTCGCCSDLPTPLPIPAPTSTRYPTPEPTLTFAPTTAICSWASIPNKLLCHYEGGECYATKASERASDPSIRSQRPSTAAHT